MQYIYSIYNYLNIILNKTSKEFSSIHLSNVPIILSNIVSELAIPTANLTTLLADLPTVSLNNTVALIKCTDLIGQDRFYMYGYGTVICPAQQIISPA